MPKIKTNWEELATIARLEKRRETRTPRRLPIEVSGFDRHGRHFVERTSTSDVSDSGCQFPLRMEVEKDAVVAIRVLHPQETGTTDSRPVMFQIARVEQMAYGWILAAMKLEPDRHWFPDSSDPGAQSEPTS